MSHPFMRPALTACPGCDYDLTAAADRTCPECGRVVSDTDIASDARRRVFLEVTRTAVWLRIGALAVAALALYGIPLLLLGLGVAGGIRAAATAPRLVARLVFRAWLLGLVWLQLVWLLPAALRFACDWYSYPGWLPFNLAYSWKYVYGIAAAASYAVGLAGWLSCWRRLGRYLSVPEREWFGGRARQGLLIACGLQGLAVLIWVSVGPLLDALDYSWPGWYI